MINASKIGFCTTILLALFASTALSQEVDWQGDYFKGLQAGKKQGKPVVVHFYTNT